MWLYIRAPSRVRETTGLMGWAERPVAEQFATDPELDFSPPEET